jgi:hypothetical protein
VRFACSNVVIAEQLRQACFPLRIQCYSNTPKQGS